MKLGKKSFLYIIIIIFFCLFWLSISQAALKFGDVNTGISATATGSGLQTPTWPILVASVIKAVLGLSGAVFFVLFIYGGFMWMTAAGQPEKIGAAKKVLINAIIGMALIALAYTITYFISTAIETLPNTNTNTTTTP
ncbi:MAG: hypothetical protein NTX00_00785 [Candidatus Parcubacteria bacterium]|nr:hypothetical protein [Candidatus Parcubacteria bacterium]